MALVFTEEQTMLRESARDFLQSRAPVGQLRELRDQDDPMGWSEATWAEMTELGWPAITIPEVGGGLGFGYTGLGLVLEETGQTLTASPLVSSVLLGTTALLRCGSESARAEFLPALAGGETRLALAVEEGARYRPELCETTLAPSGEGLMLDGRKCNVADGHTAHHLVVSARFNREMSLVLVPADTEGVRFESSLRVDSHYSTVVFLDQVALTREQVIASGAQAEEALEHTLDVGRIGLAAEMLGIARECSRRTLSYLKERKQFGVPVGSFQALQHRCAILYGEIELTRSVVLKALQAIDEGSKELPLLASLAKAKAGDTARLATAEAVQMHGGIGMTDEFDIGFFMKRARVLEQMLGDSNFHTDRFARLRGY